MNTKEYIQHKLINLIEELQATPKQREFTQLVDRYYIRLYFGTYNNLLKSVGEKPNKEGVGRKRSTSEAR